MNKFIITFLSFLFFLNVQSQSNTLSPSSPVGTRIVVEALDYTNAINKYYFDKTKLDQLATFLKMNEGIYIEVNCYTDFEEVPLMNLMATADQANDIRNYLVQKGIEGSRIQTVGNGDMFPVISESQCSQMNETEKNIANNKNRRIEIVIIKKGS